jgi:hypothetical protein
MKHSFSEKIYQTGINWCVDVPQSLTSKMLPEKGYIKIKGDINGYPFHKNLVPVKNAPYRLYVDGTMMKGGNTSLGSVAHFTIEQDFTPKEKTYPIPALLTSTLKKHKLTKQFEGLTPARKKDILKYLYYIKTEETILKNIHKLVTQLSNKEKNPRIP